MPPLRLLGTLFLVSAAVMLPLWFTVTTRWPVSTDILFYATILQGFSSQLWSGEFYPRWLMDINGGLGAPIFLFYSPLPFYLLSLFEWLQAVDAHGMGRIVLGMQLALVACGITCWRWLKRHAGDDAAQKGAVLYAGFPYVIILIYFSFPIGQLWALALYPFLLEAVHDLMEKPARGLLKLSLGYALLFLTHLPSAVVFAAVPIAYAGFLAGKKRIFSVLMIVAAAAWGAAIAALYLLPAAANKIYVRSDEFISGKFAFAANFYHVQSAFGLMLVVLPLLGLYLELPRAMRQQPFAPALRFSFLVVAVCAYMLLPISDPVWKLLPVLPYLQFPYRFYNAMLPAVVLIAVFWLPYVKSRRFYFWASALMLAFGGAYAHEGLFLPDKNAPVYNYRTLFGKQSLSIEDILRLKRIVQPEYQTKWMDEAGVNAMQMDDKFSLPQASLAEGKGNVSVSEWSPRRVTLHADIISPEARLVIRRFYFPGWKEDGSAVEPYRALLSAQLPRGSHDLRFTLPYFDGERLGLRISAAAGILWLLTLIAFQRRRQA